MNKIYEAFVRGQGNPDLVSPDKAQNIERGLGYEPILPKGVETTHEIASSAYQRAMEMLRKYVPAHQVPSGPGAQHQYRGLLMGMMQTIGKIKQIENTRKEYLEMLAVDTVLSLPEFSAAKDAVDRGDLRIDATLLDGMIRPGAEEEVEEEIEETEADPSFNKEIELALVDMEQEKYKRRMQNIMAQGAAANYMYLFELSRNEINAINPQLSTMYGFMQSVGDMAMWAMPDIPGGGMMKAGEEEVTQEDDVGVIKARAIIYPLLIHEIVKGLIVYTNTHGLSQHAEVRDEVQGEVDTAENEIYDLMLGPIYWKRLKDAVGNENTKLLMHVWGKITSLPAWDSDIKGSFGNFMKEFLKDPDTAKRIVRPFIDDIQNAIDAYERENGETETPTFEAFSYHTLLEALTNQMKILLQKYNADLVPKEGEAQGGEQDIQTLLRTATEPAEPQRTKKEKPMTEQEMEEWASVDPTGVKGINLPIMMTLKKAKLIKSPKDILKIINDTTYVPLKKNEPKKLPVEIPYPPEQQKEFIKRNANMSLSWVLKQIKDKQVIYPEDLPSVKDTLYFFFKYKDTKYWPSDAPRDLTKYTKISDLFNIVFQIKRELFGSAMSKRIKTVYPDTKIIGSYPSYEIAQETKQPIYELVRIYPTPTGQKSLYQYVNETGVQMARWCTAFKEGWHNFENYLKLDEIPGEKNPKKLSEAAIEDPINSHYYVAKDGEPYMLCEFRSNYCMDKGDRPFPNNEEFQNILKPLLTTYIPAVRSILNPTGVNSAPSVLFTDYVKENPDMIANAIVCRLVKESKAKGFNPFEELTDDIEIKRCVAELLEELAKRLRLVLSQKDNTWRNGLSAWSKYTGASTEVNTATGLMEINTPEVSAAMFKCLKNPSELDCGKVSLDKNFTDEIIDVSKKMKEFDESPVSEGHLARALGTAALISTLGTAQAATKEPTRGMKNNNPGNIVQNQKINWKGATGNDGRFVTFSHMEYGIRAMARMLRVYQNKYGLKTIKDIINRWAPSHENKTNDYIDFVSKETGIAKDQILDLNKDGQLAQIINAIIKFENSNTVPAKTIFKGIELSK